MEESEMKLTKIKYFHPSGADLPNGSHYQKGGFLYECRKNANSFATDGSTSERLCGMGKHRGGIIVFPITENAERLANLIKQFDGEPLGAYSLGNFFKGKYVGSHGEQFCADSICLYAKGLSSKILLRWVEKIADGSIHRAVLVKDLNNGKIYGMSKCISHNAACFPRTPSRATYGIGHLVRTFRTMYTKVKVYFFTMRPT